MGGEIARIDKSFKEELEKMIKLRKEQTNEKGQALTIPKITLLIRRSVLWNKLKEDIMGYRW